MWDYIVLNKTIQLNNSKLSQSINPSIPQSLKTTSYSHAFHFRHHFIVAKALAPLPLSNRSIYLDRYLVLNRISLQVVFYEFTGKGTRRKAGLMKFVMPCGTFLEHLWTMSPVKREINLGEKYKYRGKCRQARQIL